MAKLMAALAGLVFLFAGSASAQIVPVNIGTGANSGDGDTLRAAFTKINTGFTLVITNGHSVPVVLSSGLTVGGTVTAAAFSGATSNNVITALDANARQFFQANGTNSTVQIGTNASPLTINGNGVFSGTYSLTASSLSGIVTNQDWSTNSLAGTTLLLGSAQYTNTLVGITFAGLGNTPASTARPGLALIYNASGSNITITTPAAWKCSDFSTTHTLTNGNNLVLSVQAWAGVWTNCAVAQFK